MWFIGNKNESSEARNISTTFNREKTQKISTKPPLNSLMDGVLPCNHCGIEIDIDSCIGLSIERCPNCNTPIFIPLRIKDYWLYKPLGGGGMGSVYQAFHATNFDAEYAVKVLPRKRKHEQFLIDSLMLESEIAWSFGDHQHLNKAIDHGYADDEYFSVFEYLDGIRLDQIIESPVRRQDKQIVLWGLQILSALQHMYDKGYLFRDLKPQNIIIDNQGNVKLFDFGLAMTIHDSLHLSQDQIQGSPYYLPPERIVGAGESQYSEIYSLGMVLFHILAQKPYYSANDIKELVSKHVVSLRLTSLKTKLPARTNPHMISVLEKMICRTPKKRFQTYKELASILFQIYKECA